MFVSVYSHLHAPPSHAQPLGRVRLGGLTGEPGWAQAVQQLSPAPGHYGAVLALDCCKFCGVPGTVHLSLQALRVHTGLSLLKGPLFPGGHHRSQLAQSWWQGRQVLCHRHCEQRQCWPRPGLWPLQELPQVAFSAATLPVAASWASTVSVSPQESPFPRLALCLRNPAQPWLGGPQRPILLLNHRGTLRAVEERLELEDIKALLVPAVVDTEPVAQVGAGPHRARRAGQLQVDRIQPLLRQAGFLRQRREQLLHHGLGHTLPGGPQLGPRCCPRLGRLLAGRAAVRGRAQRLAALAAATRARADRGAGGAARREAGGGPSAAQAQRHLHREQLRGDVGPVHVDGGRGHHTDRGLGDSAVCRDRAQRRLRALRGVATGSSWVRVCTYSCAHKATGNTYYSTRLPFNP